MSWIKRYKICRMNFNSKERNSSDSYSHWFRTTLSCTKSFNKSNKSSLSYKVLSKTWKTEIPPESLSLKPTSRNSKEAYKVDWNRTPSQSKDIAKRMGWTCWVKYKPQYNKDTQICHTTQCRDTSINIVTIKINTNKRPFLIPCKQKRFILTKANK